ncbi:MAG: NADH-quinone oxidoreductase subunit D [Candidatus Omnitrophica bacterium ADurb.Bin292]|nr:MAG: NADH-quinone oxidoreductase subunit D [Candidatus Omnitrophica bacterium ADurb.Bin292]
MPLGKKGDVYDRYYIRILEMRESVKILEQALQALPAGDFIHPKTAPLLRNPRNFKPPVGEAYGRTESPKGELGFYLVSDGTPQPWRCHVRAPSLINLSALEAMCLGQKIADIMIILGSIDIVLGETDR